MNSTMLTIAGNLGDDPELRHTPNGKANVRMRVAVTERRRDDGGEWVDGDTSWYTVIAWDTLAENATQTLSKGARVIVHGRLAERSYETKDGEKRSEWELTADEIGQSLRAAARGGASAGGGDVSRKETGNGTPRRPQRNNNSNRYAGARNN
ncbi:MAG TPA: single-stranded DNA-binding protein [Sporichthyaceae bacterium]|jgi:single-strand DNA-binding protein|nr:single-stranded DNA-binding protein [Sporichthyaceae bacterium]